MALLILKKGFFLGRPPIVGRQFEKGMALFLTLNDNWSRLTFLGPSNFARFPRPSARVSADAGQIQTTDADGKLC